MPRDPSLSADRRTILGALGTGAVAGLAGCSFGDGDGDGGSSDGGDGAAAEPTVGPDGVGRYDVAPVVVTTLPDPVSRQYQPYGPNLPELGGMLHYVLLSRSFADLEFHGELVSEWSYEPGTLDLSLHDDFYYWDGATIDADNVLLHWRLEDHLAADGVAAGHELVEGVEKTGAYSVRFAFDDDYRTEYALQRSVAGWHPGGSGEYFRSWLQRFEDATTEDETEQLRNDLRTARAEAPAPFYYNAFRITDVDGEAWYLRLRTDEDPTPHYVGDINYLNFEIRLRSAAGEARMRQRAPFQDGIQPYGEAAAWDPDNLSFETERLSFPRQFDRWAFLFDCSTPPTNDPRFRRALAYVTNREGMLPRTPAIPNRRHTPFLTPGREERYVSAAVLDGLEDFGWDEVREEAATREMEAAGYERDADGRWLAREGENAGEPLSLTFYAFPWQERASRRWGFRNALSEWGLDVGFEILQSPFGPDAREDVRLSASFWGGRLPERTLAITFGEQSGPGTGTPRLPETVDAPPVGEPWPEYDGDLEAYETRSMVERLPTARGEAYGELVDRLTWVFNQTTPRLGVEGGGRFFLLNTTAYDVALPDERPALWTHVPPRRIWNKGIVEYVPTDER